METLSPLSTSPGSLPPCSSLFYSQDMITVPNLHLDKFSIQESLLFLNPGPGNASHLDFYPITWVPWDRVRKGSLKCYTGIEKRNF